MVIMPSTISSDTNIEVAKNVSLCPQLYWTLRLKHRVAEVQVVMSSKLETFWHSISTECIIYRVYRHKYYNFNNWSNITKAPAWQDLWSACTGISTKLQYTSMHCTIIQSTVLHWNAMHWTPQHWAVLQCSSTVGQTMQLKRRGHPTLWWH